MGPFWPDMTHIRTILVPKLHYLACSWVLMLARGGVRVQACWDTGTRTGTGPGPIIASLDQDQYNEAEGSIWPELRYN